MGYYQHGKRTTKYRVTVEEYVEWIMQPDADEMKKPLAKDSKGPQPTEHAEWQIVDQTVTSRLGVLASALRGIADEVEPKKPVTRGDY